MSPAHVLVGIDIGTSSVKVVVTDLAGVLIDQSSEPYPTHVDADGSGGEQDAGVWWETLCRVARPLLGGRRVSAVAVTSQGPTLVPLTEEGRPAGPALTWMDRRAGEQAVRLAELVPDSRNGADPFFGTAKLAWLREERPEIAGRTARVVAANGAIIAWLGGDYCLDVSTASLMQGFDDAAGRFDARLLEADLGLEWLPAVVGCTEVVGRVDEDAARQTGITAGAAIVAGGIDSVGSALEAGALAPGGQLVDMSGFSSVTILPVPRGTRVAGMIHVQHAVPDVDLLITAQVTAGGAVDWVNGRIGAGRDLRDQSLLEARPRPSAITVVPSLAGERTPTWNAAARGIIDGVGLNTEPEDLMLATLEGNALAMARDVDLLREAGFDVARVLSTGGGARSALWRQIKADVLGVPVDRPEAGHGAARGAAYLAGMALGEIDVDRLSQLALDVTSSCEPDADLHAAYAARRTWFERVAQLNAERGQTSV